MHYKNGREAHEGDPVIGETWSNSGHAMIGKLHTLIPGCESCNAQVCYVVLGGTANTSVTVGNLYHADDALACIEERTQTLKIDAATAASQ